ncbi:hypothetical protein P43SY_008324 [Pythium insidiosum]|uniref:Uncharacterized protein n=1 Tax=Pythium insidiosum TaxID=114742 RepID=A0AAD5LI76_PYTIN|nr:hypothetical protein P43SY_008324 [Pythium insidiosum]
MLRHRFVLVLHTALLVALACAARDESCDDGSTVSTTCGFVLPDPDLIAYCASTEILALQGGCYVCVEPSTCRLQELHDSKLAPENDNFSNTLAADMAPELATPLSEAAPLADDMSVLMEPQVVKIHAQPGAQVASNAYRTINVNADLSKWYFAIPAFLAVAAIGVAIHSRMEGVQDTFHRLPDDDQEEINPFCENPASPTNDEPTTDDDDDDLEFGGVHAESDRAELAAVDQARLASMHERVVM